MIDAFAARLRNETCAEFEYIVEGTNRIRVLTPFELEDGDLISLVVEKDGERWLITDDGFVYTHLTYDLDERDLKAGNRKKIIDSTLSSFDVRLQERSLVRSSDAESTVRGIYDVLQTALRLSNLTFLSRDRVKTSFVDDVRSVVEIAATSNRVQRDWHDPSRDPAMRYKTDYRIDAGPSQSPILIFTLTGESKTRDATISLLKYKEWAIDALSVGVFYDMSQIERAVLDRFIEASDKQIVNFSGANREELATTIKERLAA